MLAYLSRYTHRVAISNVDPQAWLADMLARLPDRPARRIDEFLPWNWQYPREQKAAA